MKRSTIGFLMTGTILLLVMLLMVGAGLGLRAWDRFRQLKDTPETRSAFLTNYNPLPVVDQFKRGRSYAQGGPEINSSSDTKSVFHQSGFEWGFAMMPDQRVPLMSALNEDVNVQLLHNGAQILSRTGDLDTGFHYAYRLGKATGTVVIPPVAITSSTSVADRQAGRIGIDARVELKETWFPKEEAAIQASLKPVQ
jgi:hypothetical protein